LLAVPSLALLFLWDAKSIPMKEQKNEIGRYGARPEEK
jgi:hypothetical protein